MDDLRRKIDVEYVPNEMDIFEKIVTEMEIGNALDRFLEKPTPYPPSILRASNLGRNWADVLGDDEKEVHVLRKRGLIQGTIERTFLYTDEYLKYIGKNPDNVDKEHYNDMVISVLWDYVRTFTFGRMGEDMASDILDIDHNIGHMSKKEANKLENKGIDLIDSDNVTYQVKVRTEWGGKQRQTWVKNADRLIIVNCERNEVGVFDP